MLPDICPSFLLVPSKDHRSSISHPFIPLDRWLVEPGVTHELSVEAESGGREADPVEKRRSEIVVEMDLQAVIVKIGLSRPSRPDSGGETHAKGSRLLLGAQGAPSGTGCDRVQLDEAG